VATTAQDGSVFQAGGPFGSENANWATGRCEALHDQSCLLRQIAGEDLMHFRRVDHEFHRGLVALAGRILERHQGRAQDRVLRGGGDVAQDLALVRGKGRDEDEPDNVLGVSGGVGDDRAAVGVPDEEHRAGDLADPTGGVGGVVGDAPQRIGRGDDRDTRRLQPFDDPAPTRAIGKRTVHEHNREGSSARGGGRSGNGHDGFLLGRDGGRFAARHGRSRSVSGHSEAGSRAGEGRTSNGEPTKRGPA
jgi:hypothetical protein